MTSIVSLCNENHFTFLFCDAEKGQWKLAPGSLDVWHGEWQTLRVHHMWQGIHQEVQSEAALRLSLREVQVVLRRVRQGILTEGKLWTAHQRAQRAEVQMWILWERLCCSGEFKIPPVGAHWRIQIHLFRVQPRVQPEKRLWEASGFSRTGFVRKCAGRLVDIDAMKRCERRENSWRFAEV